MDKYLEKLKNGLLNYEISKETIDLITNYIKEATINEFYKRIARLMLKDEKNDWKNIIANQETQFSAEVIENLCKSIGNTTKDELFDSCFKNVVDKYLAFLNTITVFDDNNLLEFFNNYGR